MAAFDPRLLTPPQESEEVYPYRRVWRSVVIECSIVLGVAVGALVLFGIIGLRLPDSVRQVTAPALALLPLALWLVFSWLPERSVPEPRQRLLAVLVISALAANAVGLPLINEFFQVDRWLPLTSAIDRIIGYTFTVGIVQELLKYLVLRYVAWPDGFRTRLDGVAYAAANAVGYATVLNLHLALTGVPSPDIVAGRVFDSIALHTVTSIVVGYALAELRFGQPSAMFTALSVALAAAITGIAVPLRAGLMNANLALGISSTRPLFALGFSIALLVGLSVAVAFLFNSAERREREAAAQRET